MTASSESSPPAAPQNGRWKWLLRLALGLLLIVLLVAHRGGDEVRRALQTVSPLVLVAAVVFYWAGQVLSAWKWRLLLLSRGIDLPLLECCRLYLTGMFWNLWMPTNVGGDAARALLAAPRCGGLAIASASILVERLTGLMALLIIGVLAWALGLGHTTNAAPAASSALLLKSCAALTILAFCLIAARAAALHFEQRVPGNRLVKKWAGLHRALDVYTARGGRGALVTALLLSLLFQSSQIILNMGLARAVGLDVPLLVFWWLVPLLSLASLLPVGIGGLGVREAAAVSLLGSAPHGTVLAWSLLWQVTVWLASLPGGWFAWKRT